MLACIDASFLRPKLCHAPAFQNSIHFRQHDAAGGIYLAVAASKRYHCVAELVETAAAVQQVVSAVLGPGTTNPSICKPVRRGSKIPKNLGYI